MHFEIYTIAGWKFTILTQVGGGQGRCGLLEAVFQAVSV